MVETYHSKTDQLTKTKGRGGGCCCHVGGVVRGLLDVRRESDSDLEQGARRAGNAYRAALLGWSKGGGMRRQTEVEAERRWRFGRWKASGDCGRRLTRVAVVEVSDERL